MTFRERVARRRKEQTRNLKKAAHVAALVGIAAISIGLTSCPTEDTHLVETVYTVQPGDTWWGIVERFREMDADDRYILDYKSEMERLNDGVDLGNLKPGQKLRIQYREGGSESGKS